MSRTRTISPDFWTCEAVIDCAPMTRLLFIGLWNFADGFGVQPLRPRTIRIQVFPGDDVDSERVRAMIEELARHGLVRLYSVDGQEYVAIADWDQIQRVGKRARRRYPADPAACPEPMADHGKADDPAAQTIANYRIVEPADSASPSLQSPSPAAPSAAPAIGEADDPAMQTIANHRMVEPAYSAAGHISPSACNTPSIR